MKRGYCGFLIIVCLIISINQLRAQAFFVGSPSGNYALNCNTTVITMTTNSSNVPYTYTWTVPGNTLYGNYANITVVGNWTVIGQNSNTSATSQQTFVISTNTLAPNVVVSPTVVNVTCSLGAVTFTGTSNLGPNVTTNWFKFNPAKIYVGAASGTINVFQPANPGVYWFESVNNLSGCVSSKSVMVTSSVGLPSFSVSSTTGFSLGCGSNSCISAQISSVITSPTLNVACNFAFVPPPGTLTPVYNTFTSQSICTPGVWTFYTRDNTNNCISSMMINIFSNTVAPNAFVSQPLTVLSCSQPTMLLTGISDNLNTAISWIVPPSFIVNSSTLVASIVPVVPNSTNMISSAGTYTLVVQDINSLCVGTRSFTIMQDLRKPIFTVNASGNSVISCIDPSVTLVPVITPTIAVALVPSFVWQAPLSATVNGAALTTTTGGSHTVTATSAINGCTHQATYLVGVDMAMAVTDATVITTCPATTIFILPNYSSTVGLTFAWSGPPSAIISATNQSTILGNAIGNYTCVITNTFNGCTNTVVCSVVCNTGLQTNHLNSNILVFPNPSTGKIYIETDMVDSKLFLYDLQGKLVLERELRYKNNVLDLDLHKGYYLYKIMQGDKVLKRDKLIIE